MDVQVRVRGSFSGLNEVRSTKERRHFGWEPAVLPRLASTKSAPRRSGDM